MGIKSDQSDQQIAILISKFIDASLKHNTAIMSGDWKTANMESKKIHKVFLRIIEMGKDAREELLKLVDHDNLSVSAMAATYSLKYNPEKSLSALRRIARDPGLLGFRVERSIKNWEEGNWKLE